MLVYSSAERLYLARGAKILRSSDSGKSWQPWAVLPVGFWRRLAMGVPLLARLLRLGVHHLVFAGETAVAVVNRESYLIDGDSVQPLGGVRGSRPMMVCAAANTVYYGEYRSNPERSAVHVYELDIAGGSWKPVWRFEGVRHVHGVFYDPFAGSIWVTTGDSNAESAIWRTDDSFCTLLRVAGGCQQLRVVQLLFTRDYVYFGSDAPDKRNYIYRMGRVNGELERLQAVGGSVFFGCSVGRSLFFSTAVEPSQINNSRYVEVWRSDNGEDWYRFLAFQKDSLPMKHFQYGQVLFPAGLGDSKHLYCRLFATKGHGKTFIVDIEPTASKFLERTCK